VIIQLDRDGGIGLRKEEAIAAISTALSNVDIFVYIVMDKNERFSFSNLSLNGHLLEILCSVAS
jgi:hypothetical protein